jgi:chromosome segregation ATPase
MTNELENSNIIELLGKPVQKIWDLIKVLISHLQKEISNNRELRQQNTILQEKVDIIESQLKSISLKSDELELSNLEKDEIIAKHNSDNFNLNERIKELNWEVDEINKVLNIDKEQIRLLQDKIDNTEKINGQYAILQEKNKILQAAIDELTISKIQLTSQLAEIPILKEQILQREAEIATAQIKISENEKIIEQLRIKIEEHINNIYELESSKVPTNEQATKQEEEIAKLQSLIIKSQKINDNFKSQIEILNTEVKSKNEQIKKLSSDIKAQKQELSEKDRAFSKLESKLKEVSISLDKYKLYNTGLFANRLNEVTEEISLLKEEKFANTKKIMSLEQRNQEYEHKIDALIQSLSEKQSLLEQKNTEYKNKNDITISKILNLQKLLKDNELIN